MACELYPNDLAPAELLKYLPDYEVVICTACSYAVQPKAVSRHLKEIHRVLRSRRRKFDLYVTGLRLRDPQDVEPPSDPGQFPVPYLPVEPGFRCRVPGCDHMCASTKRMEAHWRHYHGRKGYRHEDYTPTPLQTFFRGNLLRYFTSPDPSAVLNTPVSLPAIDDTCIPETTTLTTTDTSLLTHYFTTTYRTFVTGPETTPLWQSVIPTLATQHGFLLHGLLACTALHKAYLSHGPALKQSYTLLACTHQDVAFPGFRAAIANPTIENSHAILAFSHLLIIYSFASSTTNPDDLDAGSSLFLAESDPDQHGHQYGTPSQLLPNWLYFIRGSCCMLKTVMPHILAGPVHSLIDAWGDRPQEGDDGGRQTVLLRHLLSVIPSIPASPYADINGRTATGNGNGTGNVDLWAPDTIRIYTEAAKHLNTTFLYLRRYAPETITAWNILRVWPMVVSLEYITLLQEQHPGALILLAHYCILLKCLEKYWYFEGKARFLLLSVWKRLHPEWHVYIQGAVECVLGGGDPRVWVREAFA
ncbi:hypothetical protein BDV12DRAFT_209519, partial [Aspergillus spectabilis]